MFRQTWWTLTNYAVRFVRKRIYIICSSKGSMVQNRHQSEAQFILNKSVYTRNEDKTREPKLCCLPGLASISSSRSFFNGNVVFDIGVGDA